MAAAVVADRNDDAHVEHAAAWPSHVSDDRKSRAARLWPESQIRLAERLGKTLDVRPWWRPRAVPSMGLSVTASTLSMREAQVLSMAARGLTNAQIGEVLGV